jgi:hypothetical protein
MAENILKLKKRALAAGMPKSDAMKADRAELEAFLTGDGETEKPRKKAVAKKKGKSSTKKVSSVKKSSTKKSAGSKKAPATKSVKSTGKAKRPSSNATGGRANIDKSSIDWSAESDEWNPREGGPVSKLFKALKSSKGNIDKAFDKLADDMYEFVGKKKRDGSKRTKAEAEAMLRYRLNRTLYEFAKRTGQHESATDHVEYGTGVYATVRKKRSSAKKSSAKKSSSKKSTSKKSGRKSSTRKKK